MLQLASGSDREAVERLARQVHGLHVGWRPDIFEMPDALFCQERFQREVKDRNLYVAKLDGTVIGYALLKIRNYDWPGVVPRRVMLVEEFGVEESLRNQGFGREMMEDIHALAKAFRCTDLQLGVYPQNDDAVGFYQKCGFTIRSIEMQTKV